MRPAVHPAPFPVRLNRFLSQCGLGSRRGCEQIISEGRVSINGKTIGELGTLVQDDDEVEVDGRVVRARAAVVLALHKPKGYVCSRSDERDRMTIYALLPRQYQALHHVGRLDKESEGLLLLTNQGELSHRLMHPSMGAEKEYEVVVDQPMDVETMAKLTRGMLTEEGQARAERAWLITPHRCHVVLKQGLKRQIRLMFYQLGFEVERLTRTRIGWLELKGLPKAGYRELSQTEVQRFFTEAGTRGRPAKPSTTASAPSAQRERPVGDQATHRPQGARRSFAAKRPDFEGRERSPSSRPAGPRRFAGAGGRPPRRDFDESAREDAPRRSGPGRAAYGKSSHGARKSSPHKSSFGGSARGPRREREEPSRREDSRGEGFDAPRRPAGPSRFAGAGGRPPRRDFDESAREDAPRRSGPGRAAYGKSSHGARKSSPHKSSFGGSARGPRREREEPSRREDSRGEGFDAPRRPAGPRRGPAGKSHGPSKAGFGPSRGPRSAGPPGRGGRPRGRS